MKEDENMQWYDEWAQQRADNYHKKHLAFYAEPSIEYIAPFRMADDLYYVGDKSFTIDLGGFTISQDGAVNDYLLNFKNSGSKANTITLKNGTLDAGKTAYCAFATSSSTGASTFTLNVLVCTTL